MEGAASTSTADAAAVAAESSHDQPRPSLEAKEEGATVGPALPSGIPSPVVRSPPEKAAAGAAAAAGVAREDSLDSIGAEEEEEEREDPRGVRLPFRSSPLRPRGRRRGRVDSAAGSEDGGVRVRPLPPTPVGGGGASGPQPLTIVLVGGFLLPPSEEFHTLYWGEALAEEFASQHRILCVHPGPIASLHDRVCQIFYELKGGNVSYGKGHSHRYGHASEGDEEHPGLLPEWDAEHPVHLIGHSFGGLTIRLLLHYLEKQAFAGHDTSPDWVRSVTTINAPHNGTHLVYGLGADPRHPPIVHWGSPGHLLGTLAHVVEFMDLPLLRSMGIDFGLSYFHLSRRFGLFSGLAKVVKALLGLSNVCTTPDNAAYDMTVHAALRINKVTTTYPGLFYFSFVGTCARHRSSSPAAEEEKEVGNGDSSNSGSSPLSTPSIDREQPQSQRLTALVKFLAYRLMAWHVRGVKFESGGTGEGVFAMLGPEANAAATRWAEDGASDGVVSVFSQAFPRVPLEEPHHPAGLPDDYRDLVSGRWYVTELPVDHMGVVGYPHSRHWQHNFFQALYGLLAHCHGRVWEGAMTPCTPLSSTGSSIPSPAAVAPDAASPTMLTTPVTAGGGAKDFTWAALSTPRPRPRQGESGSSDCCSSSSSRSSSPTGPTVPLHRQPTLSQQPSRREIRRLERRGSWVLARQQSVCQCAGAKGDTRGDGTVASAAATASPSTRMLLCEECNKGLLPTPHTAGAAEGAAYAHQHHHDEQEVEEDNRGQAPWWLLMALLLLPSLSLLLLSPGSGQWAAATLAGWVGGWALTYHTIPVLLLLDSTKSSSSSQWAHSIIGVVHAGVASLASLALLLVVHGEQQWWWQRQVQLASCAYYTLSLALALQNGKGRQAQQQEWQEQRRRGHVHVSRAWQAVLLFLHSALLHLASSCSLEHQHQHQQLLSLLVAFLGLVELPNGLLALRDLLLLGGHIHHDHDTAAAAPAPTTTPKPSAHPRHQHHPPVHMAGTRMAAAVWVSIWAAFFLCQLFPVVYLAFMALALLPSAAASTSAAASKGVATALMVVAGGAACVGLVGRMQALSERFQLDFAKKHLQATAQAGGGDGRGH